MVLGRKSVHQTMISVNKLGQLALSKLAKKLNATVKYCSEEIPFDKFFRESKPCGDFHMFMTTHYKIFLWDYEFGLLEIHSSIVDLGTMIGLAFSYARREDQRNCESTPSHLAIYSYTSHEDGDGKKIETKELQIYRFDDEKLSEWFENY